MTSDLLLEHLLEQIRNFHNQNFDSPRQMETAFWNLTAPAWKGIADNDEMMAADDLSLFSGIQEFLLTEVIQIHQDEKRITPDIQKKLDQPLHLDELKGGLQGNFSANGIYYLDNEDCAYYFVGDIHSDAFILQCLVQSSRFFEQIMAGESFKMIFLGDYVDRGKNHFKPLETLLLLKYLFPEHIYLLMGNHDIGKIEGDEVTLYLRKMEEEKDYFYYYLRDINNLNRTFSGKLVDLYQQFMNNLNVIAFAMNSTHAILGVHGGIPRPTDDHVNQDYFHYIQTHTELTDDTMDHQEIRIRDNILWSDPSSNTLEPVMNRKRFKFYKEHFDSFQKKIGFDAFVRGHEAMVDGIKPFFDYRLFSVFSSGAVFKNDTNINSDTVYTNVSPKILHYNQRNQTNQPENRMSNNDFPLYGIELTLHNELEISKES